MGRNSIAALLLAAMLTLAGCGPVATEAGYRSMMNSYRGRSIDSLVAAWGPADKTHTFADGRKLYSFTRNRKAYVEEPAFPIYAGLGWGYGGGFFGGAYYPVNSRQDIRVSFCETRVTTDRKGMITDISYRGKNCRAVPPAAATPGSGPRSSTRR